MEPAQAIESEPVAPQFTVPQVKTSPTPGMPASTLSDRITNTDIRRINGYLRIANIGGGGLFFLLGLVGLFIPDNYSDFIVAIFTMILGLALVAFEFRDHSPVHAEKAKENFGFFFCAAGRAVYLILMAFLAFADGWFGIIVGLCFLGLAAFNFFIIKRHPGYKDVMTEPAHSAVPSQDKPIAFPVVQVAV